MFYTFNQNNSGGVFHRNDNVDELVVIEANSATQANDIAQEIGIYFDGAGDCLECCGHRWQSVSQLDGTTFPSLYGDPMNERTFIEFGRTCIFHFLNGRKLKVSKAERNIESLPGLVEQLKIG